MKYLIIQHVDYESPGVILDWLHRKNLEYRILRPDVESFPPPQDFHRLIVMGGPMGADDEAVHPWLAGEKEFIRRFMDSGGKVLGICLGAQLIARVLGAGVRGGVCDEFGWKEVRLNADASRSRYFHDFPRTFPAFHWHSDAFEIPRGALNPASTDDCPNQVVETASALGIQFHLEMTPSMVEEAFRITRREAGPLPHGGVFDAMRALMFKILDRL